MSYILYQMSVANPPNAFEPKEFLRACDYLGELNFILPSFPVFVQFLIKRMMFFLDWGTLSLN